VGSDALKQRKKLQLYKCYWIGLGKCHFGIWNPWNMGKNIWRVFEFSL